MRIVYVFVNYLLNLSVMFLLKNEFLTGEVGLRILEEKDLTPFFLVLNL